MSGLLATKLHQPSLPPKYVPRPSLVQRLQTGMEAGRQITLVSAPAGFGKTTCVSEWVATLDLPVTWLSLDKGDDDPGRFFSYLIAALQKIRPHLCREIEAVLRAGQLPPTEILLSTLINEILGVEERFLLVLDDFQVLQDETILAVVVGLVENLPSQLHLLILTREDPPLPLARLRANNQLTEIRAADLRFTGSEVARFLNTIMDLSLSTAEVAALEERTEGWIAGLHLAGLSLRDQTNPADFIANLRGSHRFILSYLTEEVLNQQPPEIQQFLLQTSILDRLNGDLCNAVTGRTDGHDLLEHLLHANLFLLPLDNEGNWYRYHQLFADLLRDRQNTLYKDQTPALHQRASRWFLQAETFVSEAIQHAIDGADYDLAVTLIESHAMDMLMQWHLKTVEGWMRAIPAEWIAQSPRANLAFAWMHLMRGNHPQAFPYLQRLGELFADPRMAASVGQQDPALEAKWLSLQAMLLNAQGQSAQSVELCQRALALVAQNDVQVRSMVYLGLANAYQQMNAYEQAVEAYETLIQLGQSARNSVSELLGISGLGLLALQHGQYQFAYEMISRGFERIEQSGALPPISTAVYGELGVIHYQWHQLDLAHHYFQRSIQVSTLSGYSDAKLYYGVILSRLYQIQGDLEAAAEELQKTVDLMHVEAPAAVRGEIISQQVRIYLAQGDLAQAERTIQNQGFSFQGGFAYPDLEAGPKAPAFERDNVSFSMWILYLSALRILLYRAQINRGPANLEAGVELADQLLAGALENQFIPFAIETLLLRGQMHGALGNGSASQADFVQALALADPEGLISIFLEEGLPVAQALVSLLAQNKLGKVDPEYVRRIVAAFQEDSGTQSDPAPKVVPVLDDIIDPLSSRELEILQLISQGYSNKEIAGHLVVTLHTVKKHSSNIYAKLGVSSRTQAVARARQLNLI